MRPPGPSKRLKHRQHKFRLLARLEECTPRSATMSLINRRMYTQSTTNHIYSSLRSLLRGRRRERRRSLSRNSGNVTEICCYCWRRRRLSAAAESSARRLTNRDAMRSWRFFKTVTAIRRAYYDEERILRHRHWGKKPSALLLWSRYERQRINTRPIYSPSFHTRLMLLPSMTLTSHKTPGCRVIF